MRRKRQAPMAEINVVPYIDVMLVLLVIFMITAPLLTQGIHVSLPTTHSKTIVQPNQLPMIVSVNANGQYFLNTQSQPNQPVGLQRLMVAVSAQRQLQPNRQVLVKGDKNVSYAKVIQLMATLQQAGIQEIGMLTEPS